MDQQRVNAKHIAYNMLGYGFTLNSICGMLGNFQSESTMNPNLVEYSEWRDPPKKDRFPGLGNYGFGLAQWTPWWGLEGSTESQRNNYHGSNKPTYGQWAMDRGYTFNRQNGGTGGTMKPQLLYLSEGQGGYRTSEYYNVTFAQYKAYTGPADEAGRIWYRNYERSKAASYGSRPQNSLNWWDYLYPIFGGGVTPQPPTPDPDTPTPARSIFIFGGRNTWHKLHPTRR